MTDQRDKDGKWLFQQLQKVMESATEKDVDEYVIASMFLVFAHQVNFSLAPNCHVATAVALRIFSEACNQTLEGDEDESAKSRNEVLPDQSNSVPEGTTLH